MSGDFVSPLIRTIKHHLSNVKLNGDAGQETFDYFINDYPRIGSFYMLPKIHKRLHSVPGRPVISNCSYFTENISAFLDHHLQPLAQNVNSYIKDTNDFLKKLRDLPNLPEDFLLCTVDVVGLYPNITHDDGLAALKGRFHDIFLRANFARAIFARRNISARVHSTTKSVFCISILF